MTIDQEKLEPWLNQVRDCS